MSILRHSFVRRLGFWALLQALPSESALKTYLKSVFLALCSAVISSILLGALVTVGMIVLFRALILNGVAEWIAALTVSGLGFAVLLAFIYLFFRAIQNMVVVQNTEEVREQALKSPAGRIFDAIKSGLVAGYTGR